MDTRNDSRIPQYGDLAELAGKRVIVGAKQLRKALEKGAARCVFLAENADPALTEPLEQRCKTGDVPCHWVRSMQDLGLACGIEVGAAAAAVVD